VLRENAQATANQWLRECPHQGNIAYGYFWLAQGCHPLGRSQAERSTPAEAKSLVAELSGDEDDRTLTSRIKRFQLRHHAVGTGTVLLRLNYPLASLVSRVMMDRSDALADATIADQGWEEMEEDERKADVQAQVLNRGCVMCAACSDTGWHTVKAECTTAHVMGACQ
jgi:hypothetical protein